MTKEEWNSWEWQYKNSIVRLNDMPGFQSNSFNMRIPPYYAELIDWGEVGCPIRKIAVPNQLENREYKCRCESINPNDSLGEHEVSPLPNLLHRYKNRVVLLTTSECFMYCRFCTRKRFTSVTDRTYDNDEVFEYIKRNPSINDVLISGGDPFTLQDCEIEKIIKSIKAINHVNVVRIGTRAPVVMPMRITDELVEMLSKYKPLFVNTHFNHPKEITDSASKACAKLIDAGIPVANQSVLLKGVNDNRETMQELCLKLHTNRIKPYYLYQCDIGVGTEHFRTDLQKGINIINSLRKNITGMAIPTFVLDLPNNGGKLAVSLDNIVSEKKGLLSIKDYEDRIHLYPQPEWKD